MSSLALTVGAIEVGTSVSMFLLGICTLQVWNYFRNFPDDPNGVKIMVAFVYFLDLVHSALLVDTVHYYTIDSFGIAANLAFLAKSLQASVFFLGLVAFTVQTFFSLRVLRITESKVLALGCFLLTLARLVFNFMIGIRIILTGDFHSLETEFKWILTTILCTGAASDVAIAFCMCLGLMRRRSGFSRTDRMVDKLIAFIVGSGLLTSIVAVVELILYLTMDNLVWLAFYTNLAKLFSNSLMASLNERKNIRTKMSSVNVQDTSIVHSTIHGTASANPPSRLVFSKPQSEVELHTLGYANAGAKDYEAGYNGGYS